MRELTQNEMNVVAGASLGSSLYGSVLFAASATAGGAIIGGVHGGDGGGLLGVGSIGQGVGMIAGGAIGMVAGGIVGALYGYNHVEEVESITSNFWTSVINGNYYPGTSTNNHI
ncbi:colicin V synthesis protein [Enterobacter sp. SGAir0187]|uniref:colicin V synthesis protein n=1 Tax=Enterobacter sp. SGAir0187 TaxID=2836161 RepID=UPI000CEB4CA9|nr:colicin V synthesis protein [Enterobacter sp. SGAir0187]AVH17533.1 colicin V synthesis protein [Enterobacter sp. SGAir0187]